MGLLRISRARVNSLVWWVVGPGYACHPVPGIASAAAPDSMMGILIGADTRMNYWKGKIWLQGGALLLVLCSCLMFRMLYEQQQALIHAQENRYSSYLLASELRHSSDELTRLVRSYVATGNPIYEKQYWHVLAIRNGELPLPEHYDRPYWDFLALGESQPPYPDGKPVSL